MASGNPVNGTSAHLSSSNPPQPSINPQQSRNPTYPQPASRPNMSPAQPTPAPPNQPPAASTSQQAGNAALRPLNVRDALQYLDRVKQQFANEYEVYDQFLTIMKDFKTQNIDTPGVIDRVSTLFRGHPSLIQGFNTFLPPGYRIECRVSTNADGTTGGPGSSNVITVTTPMGVTTRTQNVTGPASASTSSGSTPAPAQPSTSHQVPSSSRSTSNAPTASSQSTSRLPPLPSAPAPPRPISPPAPIPPFGSSSGARSGTQSWQQQTQAGGYGAGTNGGARARNTSQDSRTATPQQPQTQASAPQQQQRTAHSTVAATPKPVPLARVSSQDQVPSRPQSSTPAQASSSTTATPAQPAQQTAAETPTSSTPAQPQIMEFNHAITYVNKIKTRFAKEPETYKTFLEILQTYQKDGRPIQEVYQQVTALFRDAPDLLDEFKAFLPDTSGETAQPPAPSTSASPTKQKTGMNKTLSQTARKPMDQGVEKKKRAAPGMGEKSKAKRTKVAHSQQGGLDSPPLAGPSSTSAYRQQQQQQQQQAAMVDPSLPPSPFAPHHAHVGHPHPYGPPTSGFRGAPHLQSAYDAYLTTHRAPPLVQPEEFGFFDRVKKFLDDRAAYTEFLKLLNLFTQEIIDLPTLLNKSLLFIGASEELFVQFKALVEWDAAKDGRVEGEDWIIDNEPVLDRPPVLLHLMKSYGPSYRRLPDSEIDLACSGRSPLEWSVLNDEWVAYATWASEGSGAHRKNPYEEALYNSEQERHWYSFHLASIARTIAHFEPIAARIALATPEERTEIKVVNEDGQLMGSAPSVYERIMKKIYGKDHGWEILQSLEDNPAVAVPIVLARLKQKDEEWKRAEKEWNKVWREVDAKNFYRALDHQSIPFKAVDKKTTTTSKALTNEIETLRRDKLQKRFDVPTSKPFLKESASTITAVPAMNPFSSSVADSDSPPLRPLHQFEFHMEDRSVLFDVLKLTFSYLDRDQSGFSVPERARVEAFLRLFVPLLWGVEKDELEENLGPSAHDDAADVEEDEGELDQDGTNAGSDGETSSVGAETEASTTPSIGAGRRGINGHKRGGAADLRKRLLLHAAVTAARRSAATNGGPQDLSTNDEPATSILGETNWIHLSETHEGDLAEKIGSADDVLEPRKFSFFTNSTFYCLVRIMHVMYHRLLSFKRLASELAQTGQHRRLSPLGPDLGLSLPVGVVDTGENPAEHYYDYALELAEKLFDGDVDQQTYEEQLRYMGGIRSYPLFTLDKLISTVIKHIHTINSDAKCQDIVSLLEKDRARSVTTPRQQIAYRMAVESILSSDENLYRIEWIPNAQVLSVQLLGKEDLTLDEANFSEERLYQSWIASYALTSPSEGIGARVQAPLLKRNRAQVSEEEETDDLALSPGLQVKVRSGEYRLLFVANTEDYLYRRRPVDPSSSSSSSSISKGKGKAREEDSEREEGEVNDLDGADKMLEDGVDVDGEVSIQRRRKERFAQWLDERAGFGSLSGGALAVSLPPLPLPPVPVAAPLLSDALPSLEGPVVTQVEEGESQKETSR
ncbi:uncharacterized protein JCM6883_001977 [Sporobolomyces salmoneus]|uniref:uncharacterized protein n=1 Tax=Sporobolomyces salmoneus TaxID=183962 RepID=UPI0031825EC3